MENLPSSTWATDPAAAHRQWRQSLLICERVYAAQSQRLYISLFGRFCAWMTSQKLNLLSVQALHIAQFLDTLAGRSGGVAANRTQRTYVAELERVYSHLNALGLRPDNPASAMLLTLRVSTPLRPRSIKLAPPDTRAKYLSELGALQDQGMAHEQVQSCAMNFLMLDAGLTLKELQKLVLKNVQAVSAGTVTAPGHRMLLARDITLTFEAQKWLARWLEIRRGLKLISQDQYDHLRSSSTPLSEGAARERSGRSRVFVSFTGKSGRPLGMRSSGVVLDHMPEVTIYLSAQAVMLAGRGLSSKDSRSVRDKGPQALRNLCCASLVARGMKADEVGEFLGLRRPDQVWAMQKQMHLDGTS